ncbi:hypothetical protein IB234_10685 [Pseudomonas sp. PDM16]|uniref:cobaltochelatase CobT-related protein n=1 Tax=Pseudomonas sp. PDM16 TaxID=2769292 RepID=UPI00177A9001|nr:hypothetical protein [Pseudomonas sp. PDM16]MBD9415025.1 hypothetical protein [Pseudomonas sp. PDM16]
MAEASVGVSSAWQRTYAHESAKQQATSPQERPLVDAQAAWMRWHHLPTLESFAASERPWFVLFERARVETLAGRHLAGMRMNLSELDMLAPVAALPAHLYRCARRSLAGESLTDIEIRLPISVPSRPRWLQRLRGPAPEQLVQMMLLPSLHNCRPYLQDARLFAEQLRPLIRLLSTFAAKADSLQVQSQDEQSACEVLIEQGASRVVEGGSSEQPYRVFSREWDECLDARQLHSDTRQSSQGQVSSRQQAEVRRLARRLQQRLRVLQVQRWRDEQEQGVLERRRLHSMVTAGNHLVFRQASEQVIPQACVTLLLDQSGSMRGLPWELTLQSVDLAVEALEASGVRTEVLGFGTRFGMDNPLLKCWQDAGCPASPGRLNALRHTLYKSASVPWRRCRQLLIRAPLVEEGDNIDGEALEWAASRLAKQPEPRKILIVFSDGIPFDEATASANGRGYLEDHLHHTIARIAAGAIHLVAIGSGQGITRYYRHALVLKRVDQVSAVLFEHLADLLTRPANRHLNIEGKSSMPRTPDWGR